MAYIIKRSDIAAPDIVVDDNTLNDATSLDLVGRNKTDYGRIIAASQLHILENFANATAPRNPIPGQLWYDKGIKSLKLNTSENDTTPVWKDLSQVTGDIGTPTEPIDNIWATNISCVNFGTAANPVTQIYALNIGYSDRLVTNLLVSQIGNSSYRVANLYVDNVVGGVFNGTATSARYADLAERFESDAHYEYGTVVCLGGAKEITISSGFMSLDVFGVIAKDPAYMMNADAGDDATHPYVALSGRVQTKVTGKVKKGDRIVSSSVPGVGCAIDQASSISLNTFSVIGRALEDKIEDGNGIVWVAVGAK